MIFPTFLLMDLGSIFLRDNGAFAKQIALFTPSPEHPNRSEDWLDQMLASQSANLALDRTGEVTKGVLEELVGSAQLERAITAYRGTMRISTEMLKLLIDLREKGVPLILCADIDPVLLAHLRQILTSMNLPFEILASCELSYSKSQEQFWEQAFIEVMPRSKALIFELNDANLKAAGKACEGDRFSLIKLNPENPAEGIKQCLSQINFA